MKIIAFILILGLFTQFNIYGQALPTQKEQYDFLNSYLKKRDLKAVLDTTISFSIGSLTIKDVDKILLSSFKIGKAGRMYINRQILKGNTPVALDTSLLKEVNWRKEKNNKTLKSYMSIKSYISMPIFSKDRKMVFIAWGYNCGITCGKESIDVYVKTKSGSWKDSKIYAFPVVVF